MKRLANFARMGFTIVAAFAVPAARAQESAKHPHHASEHAHVSSVPSSQDDAQSPPTDHVQPPPPQHPMASMSDRAMIDAMEMDDAAWMAMIRFDRFERAGGEDGVATEWKVSASYGGDFDKLLVRSEGERAHSEFERADVEALWSHAVSSYWDTQIGVRRDFGRDTNRRWAAFGVQGLAPSWFEIGVTAYVGDSGRSALRLEVDYDLSLTQRLILQPRIEVNAFGEADHATRVGAGVSDADVGLRLRYEVGREMAPYVGVERSWMFGGTADFARADRRLPADTKWVVGLRVWY